jgi:hypothetical protein
MTVIASQEISFDQFQPEDLMEISYVSQATQDMGILGLMNLLEDAIHVNKAKSITGILFYDYGTFGQILEGARKDIECVWAKILKDIRHKDIQILEVNPLKRRNFQKWSMNFYGADQMNKSIPQAGVELSNAIDKMPQEILKLMRSVGANQKKNSTSNAASTQRF